MAHIVKRTTARSGTRWEVSYRGPDRKQRSRRFARKVDAQKFASTVEADMIRGEWLDPAMGKQLFGDWAQRWMATKTNLKPSTRQSYEAIVTNHLLPAFETVPIAAIDHPTVLAFLAKLTTVRGAGTVKNIRDVLRMIMDLAVRSGAIKTNPVDGTKTPPRPHDEMIFLSADEVMTLAEAISQPPVRTRGGEHRRTRYPEYGLLVRFAAFSGLRAGEIVALQTQHLNLMRSAVEVMESATEAYGKLDHGPTKTYHRRAVPIPSGLRDELAQHVHRRAPTDQVFTGPNGGQLRHSNWYPRFFKPAVREAGLDERTRFHDLRHTYAALLIAEGAHPRAIMERMGHSTINVTLGTYGHLLPSLDAMLSQALDATYRNARPSEDADVAEFRTPAQRP